MSLDLDPARFEELIEENSLNLPASFYATRPILGHILQAARAQRVSPDAVTAVCLARVAALTPPSIELPAIVGTAASLNVIIGLVGGPGTGKSTSKRVAMLLLPGDENRSLRDDVPLGSGEGLVDAFFDMVEEPTPNGKGVRMVKAQTKAAVFAYLDEGAALTELGSRKGSTLLPTLRSAWSGDTLGAANASTETKRKLPSGRYRMAVVIGFQPSNAATVVEDAATGTAARFTWAMATDPAAPSQAPSWPGPLDWKPLEVNAYGATVFPTTMTIDNEPVDEIQQARLSRLRGRCQVAEVDAHADLARLKVAGLFALLEQRTHITVDDWQLADTYMRTSSLVRAVITETALIEARKREEASTGRVVRREAAVVDDQTTRAAHKMAKAIARATHRNRAGITRRDAARSTAGRDRQLATIDDAIEHAVTQGWITLAGDHLHPGESRPT